MGIHAASARVVALVVAAAASTACATTGLPSYGAMMEQARVEEDRQVASTERDEHELAAPTLERDAYVRAVADRNTSIASGRAALRAALAHVRGAGLLEDPMVSFAIAPLSIGSASAPFGWEARIEQRFPWPEKLSLDVGIAKLEAAAAKADFATAKLDVALAAAMLFDTYFVAVRALEVNARHIALVRDLKSAAMAELESGRGSAQDPIEAEMEVAHMEHDALRLSAARDVAIAQMNELLHRDPEAPLPPPADLTGANGALDADVEHRPEIEAARLHARAESERARRARRDFVPDLTVWTSYNSMWNMPEHRWMIGLGLDLPVQVGRRAGAIDAAEAESARFAHEVERLTDKARTEVAVAVKHRDEADHVLRLYETRLLPVARDAVDAARAGFTASRNDFATVITAERNLRSVELDYQVARADLDRRRAALARALGVMPDQRAKGARP